MRRPKRVKSSAIFDLLSIAGFIYSLFIGFAIYARIDEDASLMNGAFKTDLSFADFNRQLDSFFGKIFTFGRGSTDDPVSGEVSYLKVGEHTFTTEDRAVRMLSDGTVVRVMKELDDSYSLTVDYHQIRAVYFGLSEVVVKNLDHLQGGEILGGYLEEFKAHFYDGEQEIDYSELSFSS